MGVARETKRRRLSPSDDDNSSAAPKSKANKVSANIQNAFYSRAAEWDLEQDYERRPRKGKNKKEKEKTRLPIKTSEGLVHVEEPEEAAASDADSFLDTDSDGGNGKDENEEAETEEEEVESAPKVPLKILIVQAKEEMARIATLINEDPEEHIGLFKKLADFVDKEKTHVAIRKLALATHAAVFRDVIPGYRIRPLGEEVNKNEKLSKEVRKLRSYEQSLLSSYKHYVQQLTNLSKGGSKGSEDNAANSIRTVAINCACNMLLSVPHFNFRTELLKILVNRLSKRRIDANFIKSRETMEDIFAKDDDGIVSLEAVSLLSKMMRAKDFNVHESVLNTFLHLRLLSEFSSKGSRDRVDRNEDDDQGGTSLQGKKKNKKEFRTKKERKLLRDRKAVEKDMREADALVSHEAREKNQAETLKLVFGTYFRILKLRTETKLMGAVLEGLAKYAHLINQDFFGDVLEALKELVEQIAIKDGAAGGDEKANDEGPDNDEEINYEEEGLLTLRQSTRQVLLCTITAFALLEGQDVSKSASSLHLDLGFFITHLYRTLYSLALNTDIEYNPEKSLRLPDPGTSTANSQPDNNDDNKRKNKINFQTPMVLLLRCLQSTLLSRSHGIAPPIRLAGFTKRLVTTSLQLPEKSSIAMLALLTKVVKQHARKIAPLWNTEERKGDGVFNPLAADVEKSNVFAATVWEGELLRIHYCPEVREAALGIEKLVASG
ncbi:nuclear export protein Noc3 [Talaromyces stipitatus ATCC 10500]|uniref:Nucleolar complex-associated protein 3 n=1 Tax=Talaromyces stipitatus (strain ATCC 10500 / CBS 375.48 / QM 6759 / NRRL 1006) TaxID=441959 RepID=B8LYA5_TALSN|nr:nuclear export protein Noc3 [Talaromyces stipitatus ATCC 10500]EED22834.1 nuclear export protein Noc3 [Talaromyces stipitatus ATCC 10500]